MADEYSINILGRLVIADPVLQALNIRCNWLNASRMTTVHFIRRGWWLMVLADIAGMKTFGDLCYKLFDLEV